MGVFLSHIDEILLTAYGGLFLRACAFLPLLCSIRGKQLLFPGDGAILSLVLWLAAVMPFRNFGYMRLRLFKGMPFSRRLTWSACFRNGLDRVGRGVLYGLPFYLLAGAFYWGYHFVDFKTFYSFLKSAGALIGGKADLGVILCLSCILAALVLFALLWRKDLFMDFRDVTAGRAAGKPFREEGAGRACLRNVLLALPSVLLWGWILGRHYAGSVDLSNGAMAALRSVSAAIRLPVPGTVLLKMGLVLLLVHMPLAILRKTWNAGHCLDAEKNAGRSGSAA